MHNPTALNSSFQGLLTEAAAIATNPDTQNWQYTNILESVRAPGASPYQCRGLYKSSETTGGTLTIDPDRDPVLLI